MHWPAWDTFVAGDNVLDCGTIAPKGQVASMEEQAGE